MLTVHHLQSSQSERIPWLCEELEIPYELKVYQRDPVLAPPAIKALTPMGTAPVIQDGQTVMSESSAIVEYIINVHGSGRLALPPSHKDYADYLYWFHFSNGSLQCAMSALGRVGYLGISPDTRIYQTAVTVMTKTLKHVEERLGQVPWLAGEEFTAADIMSVWTFTGMRKFTPVNLGGYPNILKYLQRVKGRKAYVRAMEKGDKGTWEQCLGAEPPEVFKPIPSFKIVL